MYGDLNERFNPVKDPPKAAGIEVPVVSNGVWRLYKSAYNRVGTILAVGQPVTIDYVTTYLVAAIANADTGTTFKRTAVAVKVTNINELTWFQTGGKAKGLVDGTSADVAAGDALEVIAADTAFRKAGSARDISTGAIALEAQAANEAVLVDVLLIPEQHANKDA